MGRRFNWPEQRLLKLLCLDKHFKNFFQQQANLIECFLVLHVQNRIALDKILFPKIKCSYVNLAQTKSCYKYTFINICQAVCCFVLM